MRNVVGKFGPLVIPAILLLAVNGCFVGGGCPSKPFLAEGDLAPDLTLTGADGEPAAISSVIAGKVALIDFWATWCGPCKYSAPHLQALHNQYKDRGFTVVGIMSDMNATTIGPAYLEKHPVTYPMFLDDDGSTSMCNWGQVEAFPTMVLVGRDGKVIEVFRGVGDLDRMSAKVAVAVRTGSPA